MSTGASRQDLTYASQKIISIASTQHNQNVFLNNKKLMNFLKTLTVTPL